MAAGPVLILVGPVILVWLLTVLGPRERDPGPVDPDSLVWTLAVMGVLLMPLWALLLGEHLGHDLLIVFDRVAFFVLGAYLAAPFFLFAAWRRNGETRARAHIGLSRLQGTLATLILPSFVAFVLVLEAYDPLAHT